MSNTPTPEIEFPGYFRDYRKPARYKGLYGGRGSGKSHCFAGAAVLQMASMQGFRIVCVREVQRSIADSVKQLIEDKIAALGLVGFFKATETEIVGLNGSRCIFRGMQNHTAASIKSLEGFHVAWVEEAQTISQKSLDLLIPTIREEGSELWFSWNPGGETDPVDVLLRATPPENSIVKLVNWSDNPWFPDALRGDMERDKARDPDKYAHVWEGQYRAHSEARVFRNWRIGEMEPAENVVWFYGADWGFARDATAALRCCVVDGALYIDHEAYEVGVPMEALPKHVAQVPGFAKWPSKADSARPETIDYMRRHGFRRMVGAKKGKGSVEHGVEFLRSMDIVVHPRCVNLQDEMRKYAYKTDRITGEILPVIEDANNHLIDALRYAVEHLHRKGKVVPKAVAARSHHRDYGETNEDERNWKTA